MTNQLGALIGTIKHALSITNNNDAKTSITVSFDFTSASDTDIKSWLCGSRAIAFQRPTRSLTLDEINDLDGTVVVASDAGKKIKSRSEQIATYTSTFIASGVDDEKASELATALVDNPSALNVISE